MNKAGKQRISELDGLRVIMIFVVSWYHIWQQGFLYPMIDIPWLGIHQHSLDWLTRSGYVWVDGTVLLSVFLLYMPWAKAKMDGTEMPKTGEFYFRRAKRVIPAYYFIVLCHLLIVALPWKLYEKNAAWLVSQQGKEWVIFRDLFSHLSFTFNHFTETYQQTQLGGGAWTLAVLVQGYLLFPVIGRCMRKHPAATLGTMLGVCGVYRSMVLLYQESFDMTVNQLMNFMDVYVIGILCATGYVRLEAWVKAHAGAAGRRKKAADTPAETEQTETDLKEKRKRLQRRYALQALATLVFFASLFCLIRMLKVQSEVEGGIPNVQRHQMLFRPVFALCFAGLIMAAPFSVLPLRKLLGNPVTRFLSGVSMNYYLIHQTVAVHLRERLQVPWPLAERRYGPPPEWMKDAYYWTWEKRYTWLCFGVALVMAIAVTYLVEKPGGKVFDFFRKKLKKVDSC